MTFEIIKEKIIFDKPPRSHPYVESEIKKIAKAAKNLAIKQNEKFYSTDFKCRRGHISLRRVSNGQCLECEKLSKIKNRGKYKAKEKEHYNKNIERYKANERMRMYGLSRCRL